MKLFLLQERNKETDKGIDVGPSPMCVLFLFSSSSSPFGSSSSVYYSTFSRPPSLLFIFLSLLLHRNLDLPYFIDVFGVSGTTLAENERSLQTDCYGNWFDLVQMANAFTCNLGVDHSIPIAPNKRNIKFFFPCDIIRGDIVQPLVSCILQHESMLPRRTQGCTDNNFWNEEKLASSSFTFFFLTFSLLITSNEMIFYCLAFYRNCRQVYRNWRRLPHNSNEKFAVYDYYLMCMAKCTTGCIHVHVCNM